MAKNCGLQHVDSVAGACDRRINATIRDRRYNIKAMISGSRSARKDFGAVRPLPPRKMSIWSASRMDLSRGEEVLDHFAGRRLFCALPLPMFDHSAMDVTPSSE